MVTNRRRQVKKSRKHLHSMNSRRSFNQCLKDAPTDQFTELFSASFSVTDKIEAVLESVRELGSMPFSRLFQKMAVRQEIACTFLALLELIRLRQVRVTQDSRFGEIMISKME